MYLREKIMVVNDFELEVAFLGTNFGVDSLQEYRNLLNYAVLKKAMGYSCGYTIESIMNRLRLVNRHGKVLKRGQKLLREEFYHLVSGK